LELPAMERKMMIIVRQDEMQLNVPELNVSSQ
jgi:hypothetical protein